MAIQEITLGDFAKLAIRRGLNERTVNHALTVFGFGDIDGREHRRTTFFVFDQLVDAWRDRFLDVAANDLYAFSRKKSGRGAADPAIGSRDDGNSAFQPAQARPQHFVFVFQNYFCHGTPIW